MRKWSHDECKAEARFLESVNPHAPGAAFNYDPKCFARYCNVQANVMLHAGFPLLAADAAQIRDTAHPTYCSDAPVSGYPITGLYVPFKRTQEV